MRTPTNDLKPLRAGDSSAFDRLFAAFAPRVLGYLLRRSPGSRAEAEDLTQETFVAAFHARAEMTGGNPLAWLLGIARRRERDAFRAGTVRPPIAPEDAAPEAPAAGTPLDEAAARRVVLTDALHRLAEPERDAILLAVVQGLTYAEAAQILGEPVGTVKWRVHEGTKRLRKLLASTFSEEAAAPAARKETHHAKATV